MLKHADLELCTGAVKPREKEGWAVWGLGEEGWDGKADTAKGISTEAEHA